MKLITHSPGIFGEDEGEEDEDNQSDERDQMGGHVLGQEVECNATAGKQDEEERPEMERKK